MKLFSPRGIFRNPHFQTIIASTRLRALLYKKRARHVLAASEAKLLKSSQGIQLKAEISSPKVPEHKMAVVLHGWEGCSDSTYVLSVSNILYKAGYTVARLNFRDHGNTHHLNKTPFNSVRLDEVAECIGNLTTRYQTQSLILVGFSLGGNFVLRLSADERIQQLGLKYSLSVCPVIDPIHASDNIEKGSWLYHNYFVKRWLGSIHKKYKYFPEIMENTKGYQPAKMSNLNQTFIPLHTDYDDPETYFDAYSIKQDVLDKASSDCDIIYADDDPIIPATDFNRIRQTKHVSITASAYGGHCAFIKSHKLDSWIEDILQEKINAPE